MTTVLTASREQTRARYPDQEGFIERDGVRVLWERYGDGEPTILLPPTWEIVHSRFWKAQIPHLTRHARVVTFDPRGNGRSDRPDGYDGDYPFDSDPGTDEGWAKETRVHWERDWPGYVDFFFAKCLTEPHSTKQLEDCVGWAMDTDMETILAGFRGWETKIIEPEEVAALCPRVRCPVLVIHGTEDEQVGPSVGEALAAELGGGSSCSKGPATRPMPATR
jgi:pimeloyl-ACP methyl ester carboxylesterase